MAMADQNEYLLEVDGLKTYFFTEEGVVKSVDDISFRIRKGESLGLVGESGCGKSVTSLSLMRLVPDPPGRTVGGRVLFGGRDLLGLSEAEMRRIRGNDMSMIFQEPMTSLNPVFTVGDQIAEAIQIHQKKSRSDAMALAVEMLRKVHIPAPEQRVHEYPHQLSGGMRQRVMIAMALCCDPLLLIADEPTTALDVTVQAQILELMDDMRKQYGLSLLLITHDLGVVAEVCDRVAVMYAGKIVEEGTAEQIYKDPKHPYTQGLLRSVPRLDETEHTRLQTIEGVVPSPLELPPGCAFYSRCTQSRPEFAESMPPLIDVGDGHLVRCFLYQEEAAAVASRP
jgi:peptide/nickel transport system ATP-binding protein